MKSDEPLDLIDYSEDDEDFDDDDYPQDEDDSDDEDDCIQSICLLNQSVRNCLNNSPVLFRCYHFSPQKQTPVDSSC